MLHVSSWKGTPLESQKIIVSLNFRYMHSNASKPQYYIQRLEDRDYCLLYAVYKCTRRMFLDPK